MVTPRLPGRPHPSPDKPSPVATLVKLLLILLILLLLPELVTSKRRKGSKRKRKVQRAYSSLRNECIEGPCRSIPLTENEMCITKCMRPECHEKVYFDTAELELGEVDEWKEVQFEDCVKDYLREQERARRSSIKR